MSPSECGEGCGFIKLLFICEQMGLETGLFSPTPRAASVIPLAPGLELDVTPEPVPVGKGPATSGQKLAVSISTYDTYSPPEFSAGTRGGLHGKGRQERPYAPNQR
ncbi:Hypothetical predicted protein [Marmota monax]|uniref:Uncharacterized protein n=1 Tax=Marmota monax TaxID=9995 RepID=A0A5E4ALE0_MARMO|nr:Hypothetical predicted protein [Marmota monax]